MTTSLDSLLNLHQQRDDVTTDLTNQMILLLTPTVGNAVDILMTGSRVETVMSDVLIYDEAMVAIFDLKIHKSVDLSSSPVLSAVSFDDDDVDVEGDYFFTNMHITFPVTMAFSPAAEIATFLSSFPVKATGRPFDDEDDEDGDALVDAFDDSKLTDEQKRQLAMAVGLTSEGRLQ